MTELWTIGRGVTDAFPQLLDGLREEFGCEDVGAIGQAFLAAEAAEFHWESRMSERHLGRYHGFDEDQEELDRVLIIGFIRGRWHVSTCLVDGDGQACGMVGCERFDGFAKAQSAFLGWP